MRFSASNKSCLLLLALCTVALFTPSLALAHDLLPLLHKLLLPALVVIALLTLCLKVLLLRRLMTGNAAPPLVRLIILTLADVMIWTGLLPATLMIKWGPQKLYQHNWLIPVLAIGLLSALLHWLLLRKQLVQRYRYRLSKLAQLVLIYPLIVGSTAGVLIWTH